MHIYTMLWPVDFHGCPLFSAFTQNLNKGRADKRFYGDEEESHRRDLSIAGEIFKILILSLDKANFNTEQSDTRLVLNYSRSHHHTKLSKNLGNGFFSSRSIANRLLDSNWKWY